MRIMVSMLDPDGMPRAWGIAATVEEARAEAESQLAVYKARKREVGDPLGWADFTPQVSKVEDRSRRPASTR